MITCKWWFSHIFDEWRLLDCDGGMLAIVGRGKGNNWYWNKKPFPTADIAKYECLNDILNEKRGQDAKRRACKHRTHTPTHC
jgi:hypothetical protein